MIKNKYGIVINSIGKANPVQLKPIAEKFEIPFEVVLKLIYNAPMIFARNLTKDIAEKVLTLLIKIGVEASVEQGEILQKIEAPITFDVCVYIRETEDLSNTIEALSIFLGTHEQKTLELLNSYPCVILGGVSEATVTALKNRVPKNVEVNFANPSTSLYCLELINDDQMAHHQVRQYLKTISRKENNNASNSYRNLSYKDSQVIWRQFQSTGAIRLTNQSFERYEIILEKLNEDTPLNSIKEALHNTIDMPYEIMDEVLAILPVQLEDSINASDVESRIAAYESNGLICDKKKVSNGFRKLVIDEVEDQKETLELLSHFIPKENVASQIQIPWYAPVPLSDLMTRYAIAKLESIGCDASFEEIEQFV
ncbi:hypothetical protein ABW636_04915 [Aquimarina sp. 2201CG1-2-11]|uniref:hypothetical protein n=1 Tax=Aquimarina discodermiae TaxID=3231043 RepID=UPI003461E4AE